MERPDPSAEQGRGKAVKHARNRSGRIFGPVGEGYGGSFYATEDATGKGGSEFA